jgi:hypothetical protein
MSINPTESIPTNSTIPLDQSDRLTNAPFNPPPELEYDLLSQHFNPTLAFQHMDLVKIPLKSAKPLKSLGEAAHLLPWSDSNFKPLRGTQVGASKHKMGVLLATISHSIPDNNNNNLNGNNNLTQLLESTNLTPSSNQHLLRFTSNPRVSKMPLSSYPLLALKPTSNRLHNFVIKNQFVNILRRLDSRNIHLNKGNKAIFASKSPSNTHTILEMIASFGPFGIKWINYFLLSHDGSHPLNDDNSKLQHPVHFRGVPIKYPSLTPHQLVYMLFQTHFLRKCKRHQTKRKRLTYPCTCLIQPSPYETALTPQASSTTSSVQGPHILTPTNPTSPTRSPHSQLDHTISKAQFKHMHHQLGPISLLETFIYEQSKKAVRINLVGTLPALMAGINAFDEDKINDVSRNIVGFSHIQRLCATLPRIPSNIVTVLAPDLFVADDAPNLTSFPQTIPLVFYNRSGNPQLDPPPSNPHIEYQSATTFTQGRMRRGISSVLFGQLVFFDRKGNVGIQNGVEYKWVWVSIDPDESFGSLLNSDLKQSMTTKPQLHGVWVIMVRKLPKTIIIASTIATISMNSSDGNDLC